MAQTHDERWNERNRTQSKATTTHPYVLPSGGSRTKAPRLTPHNLANTDNPRSSISPTVCSLRTVRSIVQMGELIVAGVLLEDFACYTIQSLLLLRITLLCYLCLPPIDADSTFILCKQHSYIFLRTHVSCASPRRSISNCALAFPLVGGGREGPYHRYQISLGSGLRAGQKI
jgi:hypothetical protein